MPDDSRFSLTELADLGGVTPRTVRFYLAQGLLPAVGTSGPGAKYDAGHLARLRLIRRLQAEHLPLAEIRRRFDALDEDEIAVLAGQAEPEPPPDSALDYLRTVLDGSTSLRRRAEVRPAQATTPPPPPMAAPMLAARIADPPATAARAFVAAPDVAIPAPTQAAPPDLQPTADRGMGRSQWERVGITPDVELHVRRPLLRAQQKQVDRLITIARELLEEDRP